MTPNLHKGTEGYHRGEMAQADYRCLRYPSSQHSYQKAFEQKKKRDRAPPVAGVEALAFGRIEAPRGRPQPRRCGALPSLPVRAPPSAA